MNLSVEDVLEVSGRLSDVFRRLGYEKSGMLIHSAEEIAKCSNVYVIRQAFETIGVSAILGFRSEEKLRGERFTPVVYIAVAASSDEAARVHRLVWSQGVAPLLFVITEAGIEIRRSLAPPPDSVVKVSWARFDSEQLPVELTSLTSVALRSSVVWQKLAVDRAKRIDKTLLDGIVELSGALSIKEGVTVDRSALHAVIGRFLYFYVLIDRGIIGHRWIANLRAPEGGQLCPVIAGSLAEDDGFAVWPAKEVWSLFDAIDDVLNGSIFPVSDIDRRKISEDSLHLIHRVMRHGDKVTVNGRQLSFVKVEFSTLRTETISAIYELFLGLESPEEQADDGAFYTPPFLVDYVLDETDRVRPFERSSLVLDPAAGSGVFLVGAFRRILERALPVNGWTSRQFNVARKILEKSIFGVERNPQAANVCRFSLYLTLLDYMSGTDITKLKKMVKGERVFPPLIENIQAKDIFDVSSSELAGGVRFSHVVGNPPWGTFGDNSTRTNEPKDLQRQERLRRALAPAITFFESLDPLRYPVSNKRLSELFIWKIQKDLISPGGALGVLISTRSFVGRIAAAFPNAFAQNFRVSGIANLSHFRYRLFFGARSPTIALFASCNVPDPLDRIWTYSPLLSSQPIGESGHLWSILVDSRDIEIHRSRDFTRNAEGWFEHLILRPLDRRYARLIRAWTDRSSRSLGSFLSANGLAMLRGGSPKQTGLPDSLLLKAGNYRQMLGLDGLGFGSYPHSELANYTLPGQYSKLFSGNILLMPRTMNDLTVVRNPIAFSSTFNAIYSPEGGRTEYHLDVLDAVAEYLRSDVASYFFALTGRSWILDHTRLEKNDLLAVPFPFEYVDYATMQLLRSGGQRDITSAVAAAIGLDVNFINTVSEYADLRQGFEDSQVPSGGLDGPSVIEVDAFTRMLEAQLKASFGSRAEIFLARDLDGAGGHFSTFSVSIRRRDGSSDGFFQVMTSEGGALPSGFNPHSSVHFDEKRQLVTIVKPRTRLAWTVEQAYSDAQGVARAILNRGVLA
nr:N-6 DNA methylase [uncultured Sphingomonas sp.]